MSVERAELRRRLAQLQSKDRLDILLDAPDAGPLVRSLPAEELYATVVEVGLADSAELVQLASPEQFRTFVDLGAWVKDCFEVHRAITWLRAARGDEPEEFLGKVRALDPELIRLLFRRVLQVHVRDEQPDLDPSRVSVETPDGHYALEFLVEGAELSAMRALVTGLISEDPFLASRIFESTRWEMPSELEETAYQFRQARLGDLGFPPLEQAAAVFTFVEPGAPVGGVGRASQELALGRVDYLAEALRGIGLQESEQVEEQLRYLANSVLVAEAAEPGDMVAARRAAESVRDYLALGFEHLSEGDLARVPAVLREVGLRRIFQIGFSLTLKLKFRVDRLDALPLSRIEDVYLAFADEAKMLSSVRRKRPLRALPVEGAEPAPFRTLAELAAAEGTIARAEQQIAFMAAFLGGSRSAAARALQTFEAPLAELGIDRLFAAIVANALLEGRLWVAPVEVRRLPELLERLGAGKAAPSAEILERVASALEPIAPPQVRAELRRQSEQALRVLAAELGPALGAGELKAIAHLPLRPGGGL